MNPRKKKLPKRLTRAEMIELQELSDEMDSHLDPVLPTNWDEMSEGELADHMAGFHYGW